MRNQYIDSLLKKNQSSFHVPHAYRSQKSSQHRKETFSRLKKGVLVSVVCLLLVTSGSTSWNVSPKQAQAFPGWLGIESFDVQELLKVFVLMPIITTVKQQGIKLATKLAKRELVNANIMISDWNKYLKTEPWEWATEKLDKWFGVTVCADIDLSIQQIIINKTNPDKSLTTRPVCDFDVIVDNPLEWDVGRDGWEALFIKAKPQNNIFGVYHDGKALVEYEAENKAFQNAQAGATGYRNAEEVTTEKTVPADPNNPFSGATATIEVTETKEKTPGNSIAEFMASLEKSQIDIQTQPNNLINSIIGPLIASMVTDLFEKGFSNVEKGLDI